MTERSVPDGIGHQNGVFYRVTPLPLRQSAHGPCALTPDGYQTVLVELQKIKPSHPVPDGVEDLNGYPANGIWVVALTAAGIDGGHGMQAMPGSVPRRVPPSQAVPEASNTEEVTAQAGRFAPLGSLMTASGGS